MKRVHNIILVRWVTLSFELGCSIVLIAALADRNHAPNMGIIGTYGVLQVLILPVLILGWAKYTLSRVTFSLA